MRLKDLTGQTFGRLKVLGRASVNRQGSSTWLCSCTCGTQKVLSSDHLTRKKGAVRSCGCLKKERVGEYHKQWTGYKDISGDWWYNHVLRERKQRTRTKIPVTVTKEEAWDLYIKQNKKCALSGIDISIGWGPLNCASIDRIDNEKGYTLDNIQWVHKHVNFMKRTYTQEYFIEMCKLIAQNFS